MANRNWSNAGKRYAMHTSPVDISMSFEVDPTQPEGIANLKGPAVAEVLMHSTAATPSTINPAAGCIYIRLQDNYNQHIADSNAMIQEPNSGSDLKIDNAALTAHAPYVISIVGDATQADWEAVGLPRGVTPAVGAPLIALSTGLAGNSRSSRVQAPATNGSGIAAIEIVGSPDTESAPNPASQSGAVLILQCRDYAGAVAAPATGSVISISLELNNSSVRVSGQ